MYHAGIALLRQITNGVNCPDQLRKIMLNNRLGNLLIQFLVRLADKVFASSLQGIENPSLQFNNKGFV